MKSLLFWSLSAWGVLAALQGTVTTSWLLPTDRFLLGVVEAVVLPAMRNRSVKPPAEPIEQFDRSR